MMQPEIAGVAWSVIDSGGTTRYRVKETDTHYIEVIRMAFNWRVQTIRKDEGPMAWSERYWCYVGTGRSSFVRAILAAHIWSGLDGTEPAGWNKNSRTGEWREPEGRTDE